MKQKNTIGLGTVILFWVLAALWVGRCVVDLTKGQLQGLDPIAAVVWCAVAVKWTKRYPDERKEEDEYDI